MLLQTIDELDEKLLLALNGHHSEFFDTVMLTASNLLLLIPILILVSIVAILYNKKENYHPVFNFILFMGCLFIVSFICFNIFPKVFSSIFVREKPCLNPNISIWVRLLGESCDEGYKFFAVKPCITFCITSFLFFTIKREFKYIKLFLILWSLLVSYSRVYLGVHYPFTVIISDITGILFGLIGSRIYFYLSNDFLII